MNSSIRERKKFFEQQAKWEQKNSSVVKALFTNIRHRMKNKKASIMKENASKPTDLTLIMENDKENDTSNSLIEEVEEDQLDQNIDVDKEDQDDQEAEVEESEEEYDDEEPKDVVEIDQQKIMLEYQ